jgi:hypothetical protein
MVSSKTSHARFLKYGQAEAIEVIKITNQGLAEPATARKQFQILK